MPKFDVYFMTPACMWEGVEAESEDKAVEKCYLDQRLQFDEPTYWMALEQDEEEGDEEEGSEEAEV